MVDHERNLSEFLFPIITQEWGCGQGLASYIKTTTRALSATYIIGQKGEVFQGLDESLEPYTQQVIVQLILKLSPSRLPNSKGAPNWEISNASFDALVELSIDICKRHGIKEVSYTGDKQGQGIHLLQVEY